MDHILILSAAYVPLGLVHWTKAISLLWQDKASVVEEGTRVVRSPSVELTVPSVLRLHRVVPYRRPRIPLNRRNLVRRDGGRCQYCGRAFPLRELSVDHVLPRSRGGRTEWSNVVAACHRCNNRKADRTPEEAGLRLARRPARPTWATDDLIRHALGILPEAWETYLPRARARAGAD